MRTPGLANWRYPSSKLAEVVREALTVLQQAASTLGPMANARAAIIGALIAAVDVRAFRTVAIGTCAA